MDFLACTSVNRKCTGYFIYRMEKGDYELEEGKQISHNS